VPIRLPVDWRSVSDWAPVVAVGAVASSGLGLEQEWTGSDLGLAMTALGLALPLAMRRRRPLTTAALIGAVLIVQVVVGGSLHFGAFLAVVITTFAVGRWTIGFGRFVAAVALILAGVLGATIESVVETPSEAIIPLFYVGAAAALGKVVQRLAEQAERLTRLNTALARERDTSARLAVAAERMRLSRELHDSVAHTLTVTVVQAEAAEAALSDHPERARDGLRRIQDAGRRGLADLRGTLRVLRTPEEPRGGSLRDLSALAAVLAESGVEVAVHVDDGVDDLPEELSTDLFRIVQESLTNIVRHSAAATATVTMNRAADGALRLLITDPGPALASELPLGGHGAHGMSERVAVHGGTITAGRAGAGWTVRVDVPPPVGGST